MRTVKVKLTLIAIAIMLVLCTGGNEAKAYSVSKAYDKHRIWTEKSDNNHFFIHIYDEANAKIIDKVRFNVWAKSDNLTYDKITGYRDSAGNWKSDRSEWYVTIGGTNHSNDDIPIKLYDKSSGKALTNGQKLTIKTIKDVNERNLILYIPIEVTLKNHMQYQSGTTNAHENATSTRFSFYEYVDYNIYGDNTLLNLKHKKQGSGEKYICYMQVNLINTGAVTNETDKKRYLGCNMSFAIEEPELTPKVKYFLRGFTKKDLSEDLVSGTERSADKSALITRVDTSHGKRKCRDSSNNLACVDLSVFGKYMSKNDNIMPSYITMKDLMYIDKEANCGNKFVSEGTEYKAYYEAGKINMCPLNRNVNLYFEAKKYNIEYNLNGGKNNGNNPDTYSILYPVKLNNPTKTGYTFQCWTDENGNTYGGAVGKNTGINMEINNSKLTPDNWKTQLNKRTYGNKTMTASWGENSYIVRYNGNTGSGSMDDVKVKYSQKYKLDDNRFTKKGFRFLGWSCKPVTDFENSTAEDVVYKNQEIVEKLAAKNNEVVNLYAVWSKNNPPEIEAPLITDYDKNKTQPFVIKKDKTTYLVIQKGDRFTPLKYQKAIDKEDGDITDKVIVKKTDIPFKEGVVNKEGTYSVTYEVEDSIGEKAEKTIKVIVNNPPEIHKAKDPVKTVKEFDLDWYDLFDEKYADFFIEDMEDGKIDNKKIEILSIDNIEDKKLEDIDNEIGKHKVKIKITDSMKGSSETEIEVEVIDLEVREIYKYPRFISKGSIESLSEDSIWRMNSSYKEALEESLFNVEPRRYEI